MSHHGAVLKGIYYNPAKAGSFGGVDSLFRAASKKGHRVNRKEVKTWLTDQDAYALHKAARVHFKRNKVFVGDIDEQWQADLVDMQEYSQYNGGYKYILTVIDILSKHAWAVALKDKGGSEVSQAFKNIFRGWGRVPQKLQTDRGKEFLNKKLGVLLKQHGVRHFVTSNEIKASVVERFNRTLKTRMWRYFTANNTFTYMGVLAQLIKSYNNAYHRTIQTQPINVKPSNALAVWRRVYGTASGLPKKGTQFQFSKGDRVRVSRTKGTFEKGYEQTFTDEIFIIEEVCRRGERPMYRLVDFEGEPVLGGFYPEELQKVTRWQDRSYRVEKIIKTKTVKKKKFYLVKWRGWPPKFNSWVAAEDVSDQDGG